MELKKSTEANLEKMRMVFGVLGVLVISSLVLASFSFAALSTDDKSSKGDKEEEEAVYSELQEEEEEEEEIPEPEELPEPEIDVPPPPTADEEPEKNDSIDRAFRITPPGPPPAPPSVKKPVEKIVDFPEEEPSFEGGDAAMQAYIRDNVDYPQISLDMGDQGKVFVQFVVEKNGEITQVKIVRKVTPELDREAKKVVESMPRWNPGKQRGRPVRVRFTIPINFKIQ